MKTITENSRRPFPRFVMLAAVTALGLMLISVFQTPLDPALEKAYGLFAASTTGLLALHHSLLH